jgi:ammonia channel protein AmtB
MIIPACIDFRTGDSDVPTPPPNKVSLYVVVVDGALTMRTKDSTGTVRVFQLSQGVTAGVVNITNGADTVAVVFASPLGAVPIIDALFIEKPNGGAEAIGVVSFHTLTVNGFTAELSAAVGAVGYKLHWKVQPQ